jgi:ankyrin repeat protein
MSQDKSFIATALNGQADVLKSMIDNGANIYEVDTLATPVTNAFRVAVDANSRDCMRVLLDAGYDPHNCIGKPDNTDLEYLKTSKNMMLVDMVRQAALKFELIEAAVAVKIDRCAELLNDKNIDIQRKGWRGFDVLHHVVSNPSAKYHAQAMHVVDELLERGANPNARNGKGPTTLHHAIICGNTGFAQQLIAAGGKVLGCQHMNSTEPLMYYLIRGFQPNHEIFDVVRVQLEKEAVAKGVSVQEKPKLMRQIKIQRRVSP